MKQIIYLLFLLLIPFNVTSQILVNEIFADNGTCCLDDFDEEEDFVEIINLSRSEEHTSELQTHD